MSHEPENFCPYSLDITLSGVWVLVRERGKSRDTEVKMKFFIPYKMMLKEFPEYGKPRKDYLICIESGKLFLAKGYVYDYGDIVYKYGDKKYRKPERWEWDFHSFQKRSLKNNNAKFFKTVQDAYTSQFGE